jgi:hypothetical protein
MPLIEGITVDDVIKRIADISTGPTVAQEMKQDTEVSAADKAWATAASNTGYFILQSLGFSHEEIVSLMVRKEVCAHEWVDARNSVVESGEICPKCNAIREGNATAQNPQ